MKEIRILSATAILGYGFPESSFRRGLEMKPHVIAADAGSTDPGPYYLGAGKSFVPREGVKRDLGLMIRAGLETGAPVVVGTAGGSGADSHVDWCMDIVSEIAREIGRPLKIAVVRSEVPHETVREALQGGRIKPLPFVPELTPETIDATTSIVAQIGVEPLVAALDESAGRGERVDVLLAGRAYDPAVFAAVPAREGFDLGLALHLGKILECAAIAATPGSGRDSVMGILREDSFELVPLSDGRRFTVDSVAAHTLYEKSHPFILHGPGGHLDLSACEFAQKTESTVEVRGSRFVPSERPTLKLEGARRVGFRTISICGVRDRVMLGALDEVFAAARSAVADGVGESGYTLNFRVYGRDGVMGALEPAKGVGGHEVGIVIDAVAETQDLASAVCGAARSTALHYGYKGRIATAGNLAFPFSPSDVAAGAVYEFSVFHLMEIGDSAALFPSEVVTIGG